MCKSLGISETVLLQSEKHSDLACLALFQLWQHLETLQQFLLLGGLGPKHPRLLESPSDELDPFQLTGPLSSGSASCKTIKSWRNARLQFGPLFSLGDEARYLRSCSGHSFGTKHVHQTPEPGGIRVRSAFGVWPGAKSVSHDVARVFS